MMDELSSYYRDLLDGAYDCVDRIVLNAYYRPGYSAGGLRCWWRRLKDDSDEDLDNAHLMRMAGRFSRRVRAFAKANQIPLIDCPPGERKSLIVEEWLAQHPVDRSGVFLILVARAFAPVWDVQRSAKGVLQNITRKLAFVNHYSFHILDPEWGHLIIKMSGHPPFGAQIILNGHEYVACQARKAGIGFTKEGNCFTESANGADLARVADTLSDSATIGRLSRVCERWIYSACLCFALDSDEQQRSGFRYDYSIYQVEYSRNLRFSVGGQMDQVFQGLIDRTRARLDVRSLKTLFGVKGRPHRKRRTSDAPRLEVVVEKPAYDLTVFKLHFGKLTLKAYTKGERVLRFEAIVHNATALGYGRALAKFPQITTRLRTILDHFLATLSCVEATTLTNNALDRLPTPSQVGNTRVGGIDLNRPRMRIVLEATLALAPSPTGFSASQFTAKVQEIGGPTTKAYDLRRAAYDLKKLRGKDLIVKGDHSRRYHALPEGLRTIAALVILREKVIKPILAGVSRPKPGPRPKNWSTIDEHYRTLCADMRGLFEHLHLAAA